MGIMHLAAVFCVAGYASDCTSELKDFESWTNQILDGMWPLFTDQGLFYNYANNTNTFLDGASTALMAASTYCAAVMFNNTKWIEQAEKVYDIIGGTDLNLTAPALTSVSASSKSTPTARKHRMVWEVHHRVQLSHLKHGSNPAPAVLLSMHQPHTRATKHITSEGWLTPVVDPHSFKVIGQHSAEDQAFILMIYTARNDYLASQKLKLGNGGAANVIGMSTTPSSGLNTTAGGLNGVGNVGAGLSSGSGTTVSELTPTTMDRKEYPGTLEQCWGASRQ